jgi:hypothetical protein
VLEHGTGKPLEVRLLKQKIANLRKEQVEMQESLLLANQMPQHSKTRN